MSNINVAITAIPQNITVDINTARAIWGTVIGALSAQTDLWSSLSAKAQNIDLQALTTFVQSNSAQWDESADIIPTVINYLSSSNVLINNLTLTNNLSVQGKIYNYPTNSIAIAYSVAL